MIGTARATAAVTIVNALPTGVGCALGIDLGVDARVALRRVPDGAAPVVRLSRGADTPIVRETLRLAIDRFADGGPWSAAVELRSEIPPSRGLKSSSAVASALALATARAAGKEPPALEVARLAAGAGRTSGVSATGAMDDALAGLAPGFCLTDNRTDRLLRGEPVPDDWKVALFVPGRRHRPSPEWALAFAAHAVEGARAVDAAREGRWWDAMRLNSELVETTMGYDYADARAALVAQGALGSGVSGLGPALAAIGPADRADAFFGALPHGPGERRLVAVTAARRTPPARGAP
ncbi:MAG TPA: shikimate kinase [Thermoplasmata archaeon]|nr:shikimate kinase [Thermoplasmata archaeon]HTW56393.1 shikimate kinase [Thermoplasmata archaeon]